MKSSKLKLLLWIFFIIPPSLAREGELIDQGFSYERMEDCTAICIPKFTKNGRYYFSVLIFDLRRGSKIAIYPCKHYDSLKDVFSVLEKIKKPILAMKLSKRNFYFGGKAKKCIYETKGIKLDDFNILEQMEMEKFINDLLSK